MIWSFVEIETLRHRVPLEIVESQSILFQLNMYLVDKNRWLGDVMLAGIWSGRTASKVLSVLHWRCIGDGGFCVIRMDFSPSHTRSQYNFLMYLVKLSFTTMTSMSNSSTVDNIWLVILTVLCDTGHKWTPLLSMGQGAHRELGQATLPIL